MDNNVIISIKGMQSLDGAENETVELVTEGTLIRDGDGEYTISYQESEVTGMEGTLTTFQIERGRVTLLRIGEFNSQMVFEEGRRHLSMYDTPYGALSVGINTRKMRAFNYRGTEDTAQSVLVYGWRLLDDEIPERGNALMLFSPTSQSDSIYDIRELRLISGSSVDKRYSLPASCIGATVWNRTIYALSATQLLRAGLNDSRFTTGWWIPSATLASLWPAAKTFMC